MAKYRIEHHKEECIGCAACTAVCEDFWEMGEDSKAHIKGIESDGAIEILETEDIGCNQDAIDICPVQCIKIKKL